MGGPRAGAGKIVLRATIVVAITIAAVYFSTVMAWDHNLFFPWFWNITWLIFPLVFLIRPWIWFIKSLIKEPAEDRFRAQYNSAPASVSPVTGTVVDTWVRGSKSGEVVGFIIAVEHAGASRPTVARRLAHGVVFRPFEAPSAATRCCCGSSPTRSTHG